MFYIIERARQVGAILLERLEDYIELVRLDVEIQRHHLVQRILAFAVMGICSLIAFVFFGFAVIVSFWETDYRVHAAWAVMAFYFVLAIVAFVIARRHIRRQSTLSSVSLELQQDIKMIRELL